MEIETVSGGREFEFHAVIELGNRSFGTAVYDTGGVRWHDYAQFDLDNEAAFLKHYFFSLHSSSNHVFLGNLFLFFSGLSSCFGLVVHLGATCVHTRSQGK